MKLKKALIQPIKDFLHSGATFKRWMKELVAVLSAVIVVGVPLFISTIPAYIYDNMRYMTIGTLCVIPWAIYLDRVLAYLSGKRKVN